MDPQGVVTVCNKCSRPLEDDELFGAACDRDGCDGELRQHEDGLQLEIKRLQAVAEKRNKGEA